MENKTNNGYKISFTEASEIKVSKHTAEWISIYEQAQNLWGRIYDLVEDELGASQVDDVFSQTYETALLNVHEAILDSIKESIWRARGEFRGNKLI